MFTDEEKKILKEIAAERKQEQLNMSIVRKHALKWWVGIREYCTDSDAIAKYNLAYKYKKCNHSGLTEDDIIKIWEKYAMKQYAF